MFIRKHDQRPSRIRAKRGVVETIKALWSRPQYLIELAPEDEQLLRRFGIDPSDVDGKPR